ncbi:hypothetical protein [Actinokineospora alba]|uniref:hypothetical protein n=1 Tax=Actinokineospora alba TaxID=504798 RepID=UPI000B82DA29|nr:hypothetical protein [Actinokineospora alba]
MSVPVAFRVASVLLWFTALGFGLPCVWVIRNLLTGRGLPILFGFHAYGGGPFERWGPRGMAVMLFVFMLVCGVEGVAGWLLWGGHTAGAVLALALLPVGALFWWGFALPIPPLLALVRTALILLNWRALK